MGSGYIENERLPFYLIFVNFSMASSQDSKKLAPRETGLAIAGITLELLFKEKVFFRLMSVSALSLTIIYGQIERIRR